MKNFIRMRTLHLCTQALLGMVLFAVPPTAEAALERNESWGFAAGESSLRLPHFEEEGLVLTSLSVTPNDELLAVGGQLGDQAIIRIYANSDTGPSQLGEFLIERAQSTVPKLIWLDDNTSLVAGLEFFSAEKMTQQIELRIFERAQADEFQEKDPIGFEDDDCSLLSLKADPSDRDKVWCLSSNNDRGVEGKIHRVSLIQGFSEVAKKGISSPQALAVSETNIALVRGNQVRIFPNPNKSPSLPVDGEKLMGLSDCLISDVRFSGEDLILVGKKTGSSRVGGHLEDFFLASRTVGETTPSNNWEVHAGSLDEREWGRSLEILPEGRILITGTFKESMTIDSAQGALPRNPRFLASPNLDEYEGFLALYEANGSLAWTQTTGFSGNDFMIDHALSGDSALILGDSKKSIGFGPHLLKVALSGDPTKIAPPAELVDEEDAPIFWEIPSSLRFAEPITREYLSARTLNSQAGIPSYVLDDKDPTFKTQMELEPGDKPLFRPGDLMLTASIGKSSKTLKLEGLQGRLYLEVFPEQIGEFNEETGELPSFELRSVISGEHPQKEAGEITFELLSGVGVIEDKVFIPKEDGRVEILAHITEDDFYEEANRTIVFDVVPGDGGDDSNSLDQTLTIEDLRGARSIEVPKGRSTTISASLGFGAQRAFERWVEILDGNLRTARVKSPFDSKTSVIVDENMRVIARYRFSFVGSAVNGYLEGSTIFMDLNFDGIHDPGEPIGYADESGQFRLDFPEDTGLMIDQNGNGLIDADEATLVVLGGRDTASGLNLEISYRALPGSSVITSLTTLVAELVRTGSSVEEAESSLIRALGLPEGMDIGAFEPLTATHSEAAEARSMVNLATQLANLLNEGGRFLQVQAGSAISRSDAADHLISELAAKVKNSSNSVDLSSEGFIRDFLAQSAATMPTESTEENDADHSIRALLAENLPDLANTGEDEYLMRVSDLLSSVNLKLEEWEKEESASPYTFKGQAATLQTLLDAAGAKLTGFVTDEELSALNEQATSSDAESASSAQEVLDLIAISPAFAEEESFDFDESSSGLPNAFAPVLQTDSVYAPGSLNEDLKVGKIQAFDPEESPLVFSLSSENPDFDGDGTPALSISSVTGEIFVQDFEDLEFMDEDSLFPSIRVSDSDGLYSEQRIEVNLREWSFHAGRPRDAIVRTKKAEEVSAVGATLVGEILHEGGELPWRKGFEISRSIHFEDYLEVESFGPNSNFTFRAWSLEWDSTYYYRSFVDNSKGRSHGNKKRIRTKENNLTGLFKDAISLGNGWWDFWFGYAYESGSGWFFHWDVGWVYLVEQDDKQIWMYFPQHGWMWVSRDHYPYYYDYIGKRWLYLIYADDLIAKFFDYAAGELFTLEK